MKKYVPDVSVNYWIFMIIASDGKWLLKLKTKKGKARIYLLKFNEIEFGIQN